jgi:hypothetical protein
MFNNEKERVERNAKENTASVWTEIFKDLKPYLNIYYDANSVKILEPNYSYYNLKLWTALFMENNIYLENKNFYLSDMDKNISFRSKQEFFAYKKKEDENKFMNYQLKYEELLKVAADAYFVIKDNSPIFDKLNDESKRVIEELKPKFDKINRNRIIEEENKKQKLKEKKEIDNENTENEKSETQESKKEDDKIKEEENKKEEKEEENKKEDKEEEKKYEEKEEEKKNEENEEENKDNDNINNDENKGENENKEDNQ